MCAEGPRSAEQSQIYQKAYQQQNGEISPVGRSRPILQRGSHEHANQNQSGGKRPIEGATRDRQHEIRHREQGGTGDPGIVRKSASQYGRQSESEKPIRSEQQGEAQDGGDGEFVEGFQVKKAGYQPECSK